MSFIGDMFSSDKGAGFQGQSANLQTPVSVDQANSAYGQSQNVLGQQQAFLNALQGQGGIGNQSSAFGQMQGTADMLNQMAQGNGPSPAQAMLDQATSQNIAQNAGLVANTKGINQALAGRLAGQNAASIGQNAANQAAQLKANQQLGAISALQGQQANMANLATQQVGQQQGALNTGIQGSQNAYQQLLNAIQGQNANQVGMQSNVNSANAGIAQGNAQGQRDFGYGLINTAGQGVMSMLSDETKKTKVKDADTQLEQFLDRPHMAQGGMTGMALGQPTLGVNVQLPQSSSALNFLTGSAPMPIASNSAPTTPVAPQSEASKAGSNLGGGLINLAESLAPEASSAAPMAATAMSDERNKKDVKSADSKTEDMLDKAGAHEYEYKDSAKAQPGAGSGKHVSPMAQELEQSELGKQMVVNTPQGKMVDYGKGLGTMMAAMSMLHKRISELEGSKESRKKMAKGGDVDMKSGGHVPGKASVKGNSLKNDTVPAMLSPGEIVIPRSVLQSGDPAEGSKRFVEAVLAKQSIKRK